MLIDIENVELYEVNAGQNLFYEGGYVVTRILRELYDGDWWPKNLNDVARNAIIWV